MPMPNSPHSSDPSWRKGIKPAEPKQELQPTWRREKQAAAAGESGKRRRGMKIGLGVVGLLAVLAGLILLILLLRPVRPLRLIAAGSGYERNLAVSHNAYGWLGLNHVVAWAESHVQGTSRWDAGKLDVTGPLRLRREDVKNFEEQLTGKPTKTVVLFLALHGGADKDGAYFFLEDARGANPESILRLKEVLDRLAELPEQTNKVLILDATQITANWPSGMLVNPFARQLEKEITDRAIPRLIVLSSSGADQQSLPCQPWQETLFCHYIIEGLNGAADRSEEGGDNNGRITALELYQYVRKKAKQAAAARAAAA